MSLLYRKRTVALAPEVTYGTLESLTASNAYKFEEADIKIIENFISIPKSDGSLGTDTSPTGAKSTAMTLKNYMHGDGGTGDSAWAASLFPSVGMVAASNTYTTSSVSSSWKGLSSAINRDGRKINGRGMMGNLKMTLVPGQPIMNEWNHLGGWQANPTTAAQLTGISFEDVAKPVFARSAAFTLNSSTTISTRISKAVIDLGTNPFLLPDPNAAGGYIGGWLTDIRPTLTIDPEAVLSATYDWWAAMTLETEVTAVFVAGTATGNTVTITCTNMQLNKKPEEQERNGLLVDALGFQINGTVAVAFS